MSCDIGQQDDDTRLDIIKKMLDRTSKNGQEHLKQAGVLQSAAGQRSDFTKISLTRYYDTFDIKSERPIDESE